MKFSSQRVVFETTEPLASAATGNFLCHQNKILPKLKSSVLNRATGYPNDVTAYHHFDSIEVAKSFAASSRLTEVRQDAGVVGTPTIWFASRV